MITMKDHHAHIETYRGLDIELIITISSIGELLGTNLAVPYAHTLAGAYARDLNHAHEIIDRTIKTREQAQYDYCFKRGD
jgi:hypothetical protein